MTEKEVSRLFDELSAAAQALNEESDTVTKLIRQFEERLNGLRLGVEAWVTVEGSQKVQAFRWHDLEMRDEGDDPGQPAERYDDVELGFTRHGNEWRLVVREAQYIRIDQGESSEQIHVGPTIPLLEASRRDRINALAEFPDLLRELKQSAEELIAKVKAAKAVVK